MAENNKNKLRYEDLPHGQWSKSAVNELKRRDIHNLYVYLPRIMQAETLDEPWKVHFALSLLDEERSDSRRARVWDALTILARAAPQCDLTALANLAWSILDSFANEDASNSELSSVQDFLDDVRIFAFNENAAGAEVALEAQSKSRFKVFTAFRAMCLYHDFEAAAKRAMELSSDVDFVLRESSMDGISVIYSRTDCDPATLGHWRGALSQTLINSSTDPHWYVRKANQLALFFRDQFDKEHPVG